MRTTIRHGVRTSALQARLTQRRRFLAGHRQPARHARGRVAPLDRVMRRSAIHSHGVFHVHLQLLARLAARAIRQTERREVRPTPGPRLPLQVGTERLQMPAIRHELFLHLSERLIERRTLLMPVSRAPQPAVVTRIEQRHAAPRIETIMLRSQPPGAKAAAAADARAAVASPRPGATQTPAAPQTQPLVLPAQEMSRLTEHVIRQLDHRVLSWQERTGRV